MRCQTMTSAILFNSMRGSGREVRLTFAKAGIEIASANDEPIAVWPYMALSRVPSDLADGIEVRLAHDEILTLRIFDDASSATLVAKAPALRRSKVMYFLARLLPMHSEGHDPVKVGIAIVLGLIGYGIWAAWHLLAESWQSFAGG